MLAHTGTLLRHPTLLRHYEQIFLLSHMRANTSLLGHILGANPEIEGYYEMHIGYHSWRSRWRQKLLHFAEHRPKRGGRYMFDKLLHNDHAIAPMFLQQSKIIFSLRPPELTVPSIVSLYRKIQPEHEHSEPAAAFTYYCDRLRELARLSEQTPEFCYLDAQALRERGDEVLADLSEWLALKSPLDSNYEVQPLTGKGNAGDHSEHLKKGKVLKATSNYSHLTLDPAQLAAATDLYQITREKLIDSCSLKIV
jgi:hypothetical protein